MFSRLRWFLPLMALLLAGAALGSAPRAADAALTIAQGDIRISVHTLDNAPIAGAAVVVEPFGLKGLTDDAGHLLLPAIALKADQVDTIITVRAEGFRPWELRGATAFAGTTLEIDAPLSLLPEKVDAATVEPEVINVLKVDPNAPRMADNLTPEQIKEAAAAMENLTEPTTIRVRRVQLGRIDTVDFVTYQKHVLPSEWIPSWDTDALRAGAMAVKTYSWYRVLTPKYPGQGYDLRDDTYDQVYNPNVSYSSTTAAVDHIRGYQLTRNGKIFESQYCAGSANGSRTTGQCSQNHGWTVGNYLSQNGSQWLAVNYGWDWQRIVTYYYDNVAINGATSSTSWPIVKRGDTGNRVRAVQYLLRHRGYNVTADGIFGSGTEAAVKSFQSANGLSADGIVGSGTFPKLIVTVRSPDNNQAVCGIQTLLSIQQTCLFGSTTDSIVRSFQQSNGLTVDGIVGTNTWRAAFNQ